MPTTSSKHKNALKKSTILVNLWDDYFDDGFVPEGKAQETDMFVAHSIQALTREEKLNILRLVLRVLISIARPENGSLAYLNEEELTIHFTNLTHKSREILVRRLNKEKLKFEGQTIRIISES